MKTGNEPVETRVVNGVEVEVVGCWDSETPENKFDFYDFFVDGECINLGEPCYEPKEKWDEIIAAHLELREELQKE